MSSKRKTINNRRYEMRELTRYEAYAEIAILFLIAGSI